MTEGKSIAAGAASKIPELARAINEAMHAHWLDQKNTIPDHLAMLRGGLEAVIEHCDESSIWLDGEQLWVEGYQQCVLDTLEALMEAWSELKDG